MVVPLPTTIQTTMTTTMTMTTASSERSATTAAGTGSVQKLTKLTMATAGCKWGEDTPGEFRHWVEDGDEAEDEDDYAAVAAAYAENAENTIPYIPFINLTKDERDNKGRQFEFGLCCECDTGLAKQSDFVCKPRGGGTVRMCSACNEYFFNVAYQRGALVAPRTPS